MTDIKKNNSSSTGFDFEGDFANFDSFNNNSKFDAFNVTNNGNGDDVWGSTTAMSTASKTSRVKKYTEADVLGWAKKESTMSLTSGKVKKYNESDVKQNKINKFSEDYSDNYEKDLNEILKRSMADQ